MMNLQVNRQWCNKNTRRRTVRGFYWLSVAGAPFIGCNGRGESFPRALIGWKSHDREKTVDLVEVNRFFFIFSILNL